MAYHNPNNYLGSIIPYITLNNQEPFFIAQVPIHASRWAVEARKDRFTNHVHHPKMKVQNKG